MPELRAPAPAPRCASGPRAELRAQRQHAAGVGDDARLDLVADLDEQLAVAVADLARARAGLRPCRRGRRTPLPCRSVITLPLTMSPTLRPLRARLVLARSRRTSRRSLRRRWSRHPARRARLSGTWRVRLGGERACAAATGPAARQHAPGARSAGRSASSRSRRSRRLAVGRRTPRRRDARFAVVATSQAPWSRPCPAPWSRRARCRVAADGRRRGRSRPRRDVSACRRRKPTCASPSPTGASGGPRSATGRSCAPRRDVARPGGGRHRARDRLRDHDRVRREPVCHLRHLLVLLDRTSIRRARERARGSRTAVASKFVRITPGSIIATSMPNGRSS